MNTTRATLLAKLRAGETAAGKEFGNTYRKLIDGYASRFVKGADIDAITTAVINQFVLRPAEYAPEPGSFRHKLMRAVRCRWLDLLKAKMRDRHVPSSEWFEGVPENIPDITEEECERAETIQATLSRVRGDFEPHTWMAYELRQDRVPSAEVAREVFTQLGVEMKTNAVDAAYHRVKKRLREEFTRLDIVPDGFE